MTRMIPLRHHQRGGYALPRPRQTEGQRIHAHGKVLPMERPSIWERIWRR